MLNIYDIAGNILLSVPETEGCEHVADLMNADYVRLSFVLTTGNALPLGAYIVYSEEIYRLFEPYKPERSNEVEFKYEPIFHSKVMGWTYKPFFFLETEGSVVVGRESDWTLTGTVTDFLNRIVASIFDETGEAFTYDYDLALVGFRSLQFQAVSIIDGLNAIAEAWDTEWWVSGGVVHLSRCSHSTAVALTVGVNVGVPSVTKNSEGYYTRFYAFGSTRNIPQDYTSGSSSSHVVQKRLTLPVATCPNGYKDIRPGLTPVEINSKVLIFDNIYPRSSLSISSVRYETRYRYDEDGKRIQIGTDPGGDLIYESYRIYFFQIAGFTFDIESLIEGKTLTMHFESGNLAGWDFELAYHPEDSEFEIIMDESTGYVLPNDILAPAVDDLIVLFNILMPSAYTASAESELEEALDEEIEKQTSNVNTYEVSSYPVAFQSSGISLMVGRNVNFTSGSTMLSTRVLGITEKLDEPYTVRIKLGEKATKRVTKRLQEEIVDVNKTVEAIASRLINSERSRRNWKTTGELLDMMFDADGYFDGTRIKPESIETMMLKVGSRSQQLSISSIVQPNYGGDPNSVNVSAGALAHYGIADTVQNWNISSSTVTLVSSGAYYIYARCSKSDAAGAIVFSQTQIRVDEDEDYYHFLLGLLHSVDGGVRWISLSDGATSINGRYIRTGRIISQDGLNYFDLDGNKFRVGNANSGLDWNDTTANTLTLKGALVQSQAGTIAPLPCFRGAYNSGYLYYKGDEVTNAGESWIYINPSPASGKTPAEGSYWTKKSAKGVDGVQGPIGPQGPQGIPGNDGADGADGTNGTNGNFTEFRYAKNGSTSSPPSLSTTSVNPSGWSTTPPATGSLEYLWFTKAVKTADGSSLVSNWTTPVRIKGEVGAAGETGLQGPQGPQGATGPSGPAAVFQGVYSGSKTYYGNSSRVDVVHYNNQYYVSRTDAPGGSFSGTLPTNAAYWNSFGANFESVATSLLFAELAFIDNLGVKHFAGIPVTAGNLAGTAVTTTANRLDIYRVYLTGDSGSANITCNGITKTVTHSGSIALTCANFVASYGSSYPGLTLAHTSGLEYFTFTGIISGAYVTPLSGDLYGNTSRVQTALKRKDTITLTGDSGQAYVICSGVGRMAYFNGSRTQTAADFAAAYSADWLSADVAVTSSGDAIIMESTIAGKNFSGATTITNQPVFERGGIKIDGNSIWEFAENSDNGSLLINMKGYLGGMSRARTLIVGDGRGHTLLQVAGVGSGTIALKSGNITVPNLPRTNPGGGSGNFLWIDTNGYLRIGT